MSYKVAINGFGRIGRLALRRFMRFPEIEVVAVNDLFDLKSFKYLLKFDSTHGVFPYEFAIEDNYLHIQAEGREHKIKFTQIKELDKLPWGELGVQCVLESTGVFRSKEKCELHRKAGADKVVISAPAKGEVDATIVLGVNDEILKPEHKIISNASCTTNCLAPVVKVLQKFKIKYGQMTTVHAYTSDQQLLDLPHEDPRRARSAAINIVPTKTGASEAVGLVIPELKGKFKGMAMRVPVADGSVVDLVAEVEIPTTVEEINAEMKKAAEDKNGSLYGILEYSEDPLVSTDIIKNSHSAIVDSQWTQVVNGTQVKLIAWYDNEYGYVCRIVELIDKLRTL